MKFLDGLGLEVVVLFLQQRILIVQILVEHLLKVHFLTCLIDPEAQCTTANIHDNLWA